MKTITILVILGILVVGGTAGYYFSARPAFDSPPGAVYAPAKVNVELEKDYDTADMQVRHLSWGTLNYYPETLTVKSGKKVQIVGDTKRLSGCFRTLNIGSLDVSGQFTEQNNKIEFMPSDPGEYDFTCAMGMGKGKLIVE